MQRYRHKLNQHRFIMALAGSLLSFSTLLLIPLVGCSMTKEQRYNKLTLFFDGVPDPNQEEAQVIESLEEEEIVTETVAPQQEFTGSVHQPYSEGQKCGNCHQKGNSFVLIAEKSALCQRCHPAETFTGPYVHGPVAAGQCYICHDPHKSPNRHLLLEPGGEICLKCHNTETFAQLENHRAENGEECLDCHKPHVADNQYLLDL